MKKHWAVPGLVREMENSLPRTENLSREEEASNGTSHRDAVAFSYPQVKLLVSERNFSSLQRLLLSAVNRLVTDELRRRRLSSYRTMTYRMRLELALREGAIRPDIFLSLEQLQTPVTVETEARHQLAVFANFLRSVRKEELQFEPFLTQLTADESLTENSPEVLFLNRGFKAVFTS